MIDTAWAQTGGGGGAPSALIQMAPLILVFVVFYFLLIRPQQQKQREHKTMLANLKRNDEVVTSGGLHGTVVNLNENIATLEIAPNVRVRVDRQQIAALAEGGRKGGAESKEKDKDK